MAAGLGFIEFTTGDVLTAADANGYLASQVVMVFADAAARTSAIASPEEGMISFLKDTNSTEYYSGAAWVAIGGASGAITFLKTATFSSASSVNIDDAFSASYDNYLIMGTLTATDNGDCNFRFRVGGADNSTSNYNFQVIDIDGAGVTASRGATLSFGRFAATKTGGVRTSFSATMMSPFLGITKHYLGLGVLRTNSSTFANNISGGFDDTTSFTGITLLASSGTISGTVRINGISNS